MIGAIYRGGRAVIEESDNAKPIILAAKARPP
jgi:hypothetical protein